MHPGQGRAGPCHPAAGGRGSTGKGKFEEDLKTPRPPKKALGWIQGRQCPTAPSPRSGAGTAPGCAPAAPRSAPAAARRRARAAGSCGRNSATLFCKKPPPGSAPCPQPSTLPQEKAAGRTGLGAIAGRSEAARAQLRTSPAPEPCCLPPASCVRSGGSPQEEAEVSYSPVTMNSRGALNIR